MACGNMVSGLTKHLMMLLLRPPHASMKQAKGITVDGDAAAQAQPCQPRKCGSSFLQDCQSGTKVLTTYTSAIG